MSPKWELVVTTYELVSNEFSALPESALNTCHTATHSKLTHHSGSHAGTSFWLGGQSHEGHISRSPQICYKW